MTKERVIFRRFKDPYNGYEKYMCIFPDDETNLGRVAYVDIWQDGNGHWWHDAYEEMNIFYVTKQKIIHKGEPIVPELVETLKGFYGGDYEVVEKITHRRERK